MRPQPKTSYISVEIVIKTDHAFQEFVQWFSLQGNYVSVLPCETHKAHIYFAPLASNTPESAIRQICEESARWPVIVRQQWDRASFRQFFIGYDVGVEPFCYVQEVSAETVRVVGVMGAGIGWALYAASYERSEKSPDLPAPLDD